MTSQKRSPSFIPVEDDLIALRQRVSELEAQLDRRQSTVAELRSRNCQLELLFRASQVFVSSLDLEEVFAVVLDEVRRTLPAVACSAWLVAPEGDGLVCRYVTDPKREVLLGWRLPPGQGVAGWIVDHQQSLIVADTRLDDRHFKSVDERTGIESRSILAVPLRCRGQVFGVIEVIDSAPGRFTAADLLVAETLAAPAAIAIAVGRLFEQTESLRIFNQSVVTCLEEGLLTEDAQGRVLFANPMAGRLLQAAPDALIGRRFDTILSPEHRASVAPDLAACMLGQGAPLETWLRTESGCLLPVLLTACRLSPAPPLLPPDGKVISALDDSRAPVTLYAFTDLSRHKHLEEQVCQAEKMESVARLAAGLAHDFNNLLTAINGFSELLLMKLPPADPNRRMVEHILSSGNRAAAVVRQLLSFGRGQSGPTQSVDLTQLVGDTRPRLLSILGPSVQLQTYLTPDLWPVMAAPVQLVDIMVDLVINAQAAMPEGGQVILRTLNVSFSPGGANRPLEVPPGDYVLLTLSDTGQPLPDEVQAHIFEPFFVGSVYVADGKGLRLPAVYGTVRQNGGYIYVRSAPGAGTTYTVCLPRAS